MSENENQVNVEAKTDWNGLKQYAEKLKQPTQDCPLCGRCPRCGRGSTEIPWYPSSPSVPYNPPYTITW